MSTAGDAGGDQVLGRDAVEVVVVDDRDLAGAQALDEQLRLAPEPHGACDGGRVHGRRGLLHRGRVYGRGARAERRASVAPATLRRPCSSSLRVAARGDVVGVGAEHPHELADDLAARRARARSCSAGSARASFSIEKWRAASDAICGRCVMQSDLAARRPARAAARRPRARSGRRCPRRPRRRRASPATRRSATPSSASITRESSPPEAVSRSGAAGTPRVRRDQELDGVGARSAPARARLERDLEARALHRQLGEPLARPRRRAAARPARARARSSRRARRPLGRAPRERAPSPRSSATSAPVELGVRARGSARRARAPPRSCRRACA